MKKWINFFASFTITISFAQVSPKWEVNAGYAVPIIATRNPGTKYKIDNGAELFIQNFWINASRAVVNRNKWRGDIGIGVFSQYSIFKNIAFYQNDYKSSRCDQRLLVSTLTINTNFDYRLKNVFSRSNFLRLGLYFGILQYSSSIYKTSYVPYIFENTFEHPNKGFDFVDRFYSRIQVDYLCNLFKTPNDDNKQHELNAILGVGSAIVDGNAFNRYFIDLRAGISYRW